MSGGAHGAVEYPKKEQEWAKGERLDLRCFVPCMRFSCEMGLLPTRFLGAEGGGSIIGR